METTPQIDPETLQSILGNSDVSSNLIPESLASIQTISLVATSVLTFIFVVFYIVGTVRRWKVQSAVLHMQKDVAEIKQALVKSPAPQPEPPREEPRKVEIAVND